MHRLLDRNAVTQAMPHLTIARGPLSALVKPNIRSRGSATDPKLVEDFQGLRTARDDP